MDGIGYPRQALAKTFDTAAGTTDHRGICVPFELPLRITCSEWIQAAQVVSFSLHVMAPLTAVEVVHRRDNDV